MQVSTIGGYETVTVAKLKILVNLEPQEKKDEYYFKNGGKAHDAVVITRKYTNSLTQRRVNNVVIIYVDTEVYVYLYRKDIYECMLELESLHKCHKTVGS